MNDATNIPSDIAKLLEKPVAILGRGVSGQAAASLVARMGGTSVFYDTKGRNCVKEFDAAAASGHGLVVFSPGFVRSHPWLDVAREAGCALMGELEFSSRIWKGPLICVTGSNGKTTLTELLTSALVLSGRPALAVGNIGRPLSDIAMRPECEGRIAVCEVSSFQAESLDRFRCDSLIWVNIFNNHFDRHGDLRGYFEAKWRLVERLREPSLVVGPTVRDAAENFGCLLPRFAQVVTPSDYVPWPMPVTSAFHPRRATENLLLARRWWSVSGLDPDIVRKAAENLAPLPHRLNPIPVPGGITFWNDSKATNHEACIGAMENFDSKVVWIGGGRDRGENPADLVKAIAGKVRMAVLVGETTKSLGDALAEQGVPFAIASGLEEAVAIARHNAVSGENILFSPGYSSHDVYRDYTERGRHFEFFVSHGGESRREDPDQRN